MVSSLFHHIRLVELKCADLGSTDQIVKLRSSILRVLRPTVGTLIFGQILNVESNVDVLA